jgi:hypothetical protein
VGIRKAVKSSRLKVEYLLHKKCLSLKQKMVQETNLLLLLFLKRLSSRAGQHTIVLLMQLYRHKESEIQLTYKKMNNSEEALLKIQGIPIIPLLMNNL